MSQTPWKDLRYAARTLRRTPGFTATAVLSLSVGIGANAAIFSFVSALLLRTLPVRDPQGLVLFSDWGAGLLIGPPTPGRLRGYSYPLYERLRAENQSFEGLAAQDTATTTAIVRGASPWFESSDDPAKARCVSANYFGVIGVHAFRGRTFLPEDDTAPGANPVLVLSYGYWQRKFGGDPTVVGANLTVNDHPYTVIGVAQSGFTGSRVGDGATDLWVPMSMQAELMRSSSRLQGRNLWWLLVIGRLKPDVSMASAEASVNLTLQQFLSDDPELAADVARRQAVRIVLESGAKGVSLLREEFRDPLLVLMVGVGLLFLIVCLNVSHLMLARAVDRRHEMSIRTALGANRMHLVRQLFTEAALLSALGAGAGVLLTRWLSDGLMSVAARGGSPLALDVRVDARVLSFAVLLAVAAAILMGLIPAAHGVSSGDLHQALRSTSQAITGLASRRPISRVLLISQVAFSLVLLVGAGLLTGSLGALRNVDKGFDDEHVLLIDINPRMAGLSDEQGLALYDDLLRRVTALPGVRAASVSERGLLSGGGRSQTTGGLSLFGVAGPRERLSVQLVIATPGYFDAVGMTMARGRALGREDHRHAPAVAVVNETLARRLSGGGDPLGKRVVDDDGTTIEVVGVVRDARANGLRRDPQPTLYRPVAQDPTLLGSVEIRAIGDPTLLTALVRKTVRDTDASLPVTNVRTMRRQVDESLVQERLLALLSSAFGVAAVFLVCVGLHGLLSQRVAQRTREIGLRVALGATTSGVLWMVLREAFMLVFAGVAAGLPASLAASHVLKGLLFGLDPMDASIFAFATVSLFVIAALAAYLPARRASRVDPMDALRPQ